MVVAGHPIVGDATYEYPSTSPSTERNVENEVVNRMCLHSFSLSIPLMNGVVHKFEAPDPFQVVVDKGSKEEEMVVMGPDGWVV
eukprot:14779178-Ditylum_brightwellii.AAC.1